MSRLIYSAITSLDGYVTDTSGRFDWAEPDEEVHTFLNDLERSAGAYLYGRRMYEVMSAWEDLGADESAPDYIRDYHGIWMAAEKIVFSRTLDAATTTNTRIERDFDAEAIRRMKATQERDIAIGGPTLAVEAIRAGLVDEYAVVVAPVAVGGGLPFLPRDVRLDLELLDERRFAGGMVYLRYRAAEQSGA